MIKTVIRIDGMMCGMCEAHVNNAVRNAMNVKKVASSHAKGETEIISEAGLDEAKLREVIEKDGYKVLGISSEPYEKKGFSIFKKK
ncbi:heavy-metal-associated domain-containing protein [uncultured Ruminococcus sp.]|uniref:heavy-metal-associated domain-containing protein n=1 Tax=uncultured Ruminococcus sp. TaxID=165186 RepID=UPI001563E01F|nr:cation transporter [uncultured Ruminococcus sp.]